jgi:class 3 adenylate cyclase/tetratricopeptide (TPR) repeat protein
MHLASARIFPLKKAILVLACVFICLPLPLAAQNQSFADSLEIVHREGGFEEEDHMDILAELIREHPDPDKVIQFCNELIQRAEESGSLTYAFEAYIGKGQALRLIGDLPQALENLYRSNEIAIELNDQVKIGISELNIADVFQVMGNFDSAKQYYQSSLKRLRRANDSINVASGLINLGDAYNLMNKPDSALIFLEEAEQMMRSMNDQLGMAYSQGNIGISYALQGRNEEARDYMNKSVEILISLGDVYGISAYLNYISDVYFEQEDYRSALAFSKQSMEIAREFGLKEQLSDGNLKIAQIYEKIGDTIESYKYFKDHVAYKDSLTNIASVQKMADIRTDFEVSQKQLEVDLLNQQKRTQQIITISTGIALVLLTFLVIGIFRRYRYINKTNKIIEEEKNRSDLLLLNILPSETAQELKESGRVKAKRFDSVSVMFTDFQGFTLSSQNFSPEKLVRSVDYYFSEFDKIIGRHGLEKIKTIGDSYMCAGGLPFPSEDHPVQMIEAALEITEFMEEAKNSKASDVADFVIRIGINTGPVVAGVVGTRKFAYDIWGDTVNVAARMESNSKPGRINISEYTYELIKDRFNCKFRGKIDVKNHGSMNMYYVIGRK